MKLASYVAGGKPSFGAVVGDGVVTLNDKLGGKYADLREALAGGALEQMKQAAQGAKPDHKLSDITFLPVIREPKKILCVGINYKSHAAESGHDAPALPNIFTRFVDTLAAHEGEQVKPKASNNYDFEGELALVIGKGGRAIDRKDALSYVAGYTCFCDGSARDFTKYSLVASKNFPRTGPLGPWMVTTDEIPDPGKLVLKTRLNGQEMQKSGTDMLIHDIPAIIEFCSKWAPLSPGDIIATGTPEGIGGKRNPPVWMKGGDVLEVEISGIGTLRSHIVDEK
ncbi:MAG TPA: fumarylacetoacetate hydrolase family protein [Xanthobacteraceae bacterium]|nr:fumarylacetoacetate hydrolase family protein [Xanthobacteraceae bacterium]